MNSLGRLRDVPGVARELPAVPLLLCTLGGLLLLAGVGTSVGAYRVGGSLLGAAIDLLLFGITGGTLILAAFWLPRSDVTRRYYSRIGAWILGGVLVMFGFIVLRDLHPGVTVHWSVGTQAIALSIGSIGGLLIGVQETRATIRTKQLEEYTRRLQEKETDLERRNGQLEQFANVLSHDLRNPLNVAQGHLELLREDHDSEHAESIDGALDRIATMIEDLLTLAQQGEEIRDLERVDLESLSEGCWTTVATADATLSTAEVRQFDADPGRLRQLLENLFRNSIEHGSEDVHITVGELPAGDGFFVADDGPGIPASEREDVFESGYSTTRSGTGFGLAIVGEVAEAHGWEVAVTESEDGGARFEFSNVEFEA